METTSKLYEILEQETKEQFDQFEEFGDSAEEILSFIWALYTDYINISPIEEKNFINRVKEKINNKFI